MKKGTLSTRVPFKIGANREINHLQYKDILLILASH
jgi:hypothetical protein